MKYMKWLGCFGLLILSGALGAGCGKTRVTSANDPASAPTAAVVKVTRQNIADTLEIASEFLPFQEIDVYAKVSGYVQKLNVDWGTHVRQGQVLAVLEIPELDQQLQQDAASVRRSEHELAREQEELASAQSTYDVAHLIFTRLSGVQKAQPGLVAQQDIDNSQGKDAEARAGVAAAKDGLAAAEQALLAAKAALGRDTALSDYARMTAPFDSVVTRMYAYTGALLPAGTSSNVGNSALCRLSQNNLLRLVIPVPERAVANVHIGEIVAVNVSGMNKTFEGKIVRFSDQIDMTTRTMHTEVDVPNPNYELVPGMYASVKIPLRSVSNVLSVPIQAVQATGEGKGRVLLVDGSGKIESRDVGVGLQSPAEVEITSGLKENDSVIFGSFGQYRPGELVTPKVIQPSGME